VALVADLYAVYHGAHDNTTKRYVAEEQGLEFERAEISGLFRASETGSLERSAAAFWLAKHALENEEPAESYISSLTQGPEAGQPPVLSSMEVAPAALGHLWRAYGSTHALETLYAGPFDGAAGETKAASLVAAFAHSPDPFLDVLTRKRSLEQIISDPGFAILQSYARSHCEIRERVEDISNSQATSADTRKFVAALDRYKTNAAYCPMPRIGLGSAFNCVVLGIPLCHLIANVVGPPAVLNHREKVPALSEGWL
jgi:hypothetical protein